MHQIPGLSRSISMVPLASPRRPLLLNGGALSGCGSARSSPRRGGTAWRRATRRSWPGCGRLDCWRRSRLPRRRRPVLPSGVPNPADRSRPRHCRRRLLVLWPGSVRGLCRRLLVLWPRPVRGLRRCLLVLQGRPVRLLIAGLTPAHVSDRRARLPAGAVPKSCRQPRPPRATSRAHHPAGIPGFAASCPPPHGSRRRGVRAPKSVRAHRCRARDGRRSGWRRLSGRVQRRRQV